MSDETMMTRATSVERPSASPDALIDRLFMRLGAMYGAKWLDLWGPIPLDAVKAEWARTLTGVSPEAMRMALDHLLNAGVAFPPTLPEFTSLVRQFTRHGAHRIAIADNRRDPPPGGFDSLRNILKRAKP